MSTVRSVLIVDDEEPGRINLRHALAPHPHWRIAGECADAHAARALLDGGGIDLVLLDIYMPSGSGLELARELSARPRPPLIVFVTAFDSYAVEAFGVYALDYLLKPVDDEGLARALARAGDLIEQRQLAAHAAALRDWAGAQRQAAQPGYLRQLNVRSVGRIDRIDLAEVECIEAAGNYVELHMAGRRLLHRAAIGTLERLLDPASFVRVHRSALVRIDRMAALRGKSDAMRFLLLRSGVEVPVSERHLPRVRALLAGQSR
ncbi:LytTR family DNA-binding domain-containing protein [Massilia sp. METH4]|uniref:LytR/AlgR family response regulator transcription factor n=1 Tax=Massilia sp. METH4 TaxID=3123041 RepID=UPI0030D209A6